MNYIELIDEYKDDIVNSTCEAIRINSVLSEAKKGLPFGEGTHKAFMQMLDLGNKLGFETKNVDNYAGHIEFKGEGEGLMGILGHVDVVPTGDGWDVDPYGGVVQDGKIIGRGSIDDKGPVIAALYAMKALKESGFVPKKDIRLILGLDEETNWQSLEYYLERERTPDLGFSPDAEFPVIHCELGIMDFDLSSKINENDAKFKLTELQVGNAANSVPAKAIAVITGQIDQIKDKIDKYVSSNDYKISYKVENDSLIIEAKGISAHGATPWAGKNAGSILFDLLGNLAFDDAKTNNYIEFFNNCIGFEHHGESLGCGFEDEQSGKLILNPGVIALKDNVITTTLCVRFPVTTKVEDIYNGINGNVEKYDLTVNKIDALDALYFPKDGELVSQLMEVYQEFTGDCKSEPLVIAGCTYAKAMPNMVAYGALFPGVEDLMHQANEFFEIDKLILATKIYAEAIYRLSK